MYKIGKINICNKIDDYNMDGMVINEHNWQLNARSYKTLH